ERGPKDVAIKTWPRDLASFRSSIDTPRPMFVASTRTTAGLLARGSSPRPPSRKAIRLPVAYMDETSRSQLRGQLPITDQFPRPHSLFTLLRGTLGVLVIDFGAPSCQSGPLV